MIAYIRNPGTQRRVIMRLGGVRADLGRVLAGLGVDYCAAPSADQQAYLAANKIPWQVVACGGGGAASNQPSSGPAPTFQPAYPGMENCQPLDAACVARNTARSVNNENTFLDAGAAFNVNRCIQNNGDGYVPAGQSVATWCATNYGSPGAGISYTGPEGIYGAAPATSTGGGGVPVPTFQPVTPASLVFQNLSRADNSNLKVGDSWRITVVGAVPNSPVSVAGGKNGLMVVSPMGNTDSSGSFSTSGVMTADLVGSWSERWMVGVATIGTLSFTVSAGSISSGSTPGVNPSSVVPPAAGGGAGASGSGAPGFSFPSLGSLPSWSLPVAAAVAGLYLLGGRH